MGVRARRVNPVDVRTGLSERLLARRGEIEETVLARVYAVADPAAAGDPEYVAGLRAAVVAGVDYCIDSIEGGSSYPQPIPGELFAQARQAARNDVGLDTVLRRYFAGYTLLADFIVQGAEETNLFAVDDLQELGKLQAIVFDRVIDAIAEEYRRVEDEIPLPSRRRGECVERLLGGELADTAEIEYDLDVWHVAAVARGAGIEQALRALAETLDRRLLFLPRGGETAWAWLGGRQRVDLDALEGGNAESWPVGASLAFGEPGHGIRGWRLSHRQAAAVLPIALRVEGTVTRYAKVSLLASMLQDDLLATSLRELYLEPLEQERDGGKVLRETLCAYFSAERNVSSAAVAMKVSRRTITRRLRAIERHVGRQLNACGLELETALRLSAFDENI